MARGWRGKQDTLLRSIHQHQNANQSYLEEGATLLELAHRAHELFAKQEAREKRRLLDFVLSNSTWANGELSVIYRQPFDMIAEAAARNDERTTSKSGPSRKSKIWLPNGVCSGRILSGFVIDLGEARKRLRPKALDESLVPPATKALALADEFQRLLDTGVVNRRADLARRFKLSRARVTQLLDLHKLHPDILAFVRNLSGVGARYLSVRQLRLLCLLPYQQQLVELRGQCAEFRPMQVQRSAQHT